MSLHSILTRCRHLVTNSLKSKVGKRGLMLSLRFVRYSAVEKYSINNKVTTSASDALSCSEMVAGYAFRLVPSPQTLEGLL